MKICRYIIINCTNKNHNIYKNMIYIISIKCLHEISKL